MEKKKRRGSELKQSRQFNNQAPPCERQGAERGSTAKQRLQTQSRLMFCPWTGMPLNKDVSVAKAGRSWQLFESEKE